MRTNKGSDMAKKVGGRVRAEDLDSTSLPESAPLAAELAAAEDLIQKCHAAAAAVEGRLFGGRDMEEAPAGSPPSCIAHAAQNVHAGLAELVAKLEAVYDRL